MKKCILLFVILIAVLTLTLVAFACQEDRAVDTANAVTTSNFGNFGVVKPNFLPFLDFASTQYLAGTPTTTGIYCTNADGFTLAEGVYLDGTGNTMSSVSCNLKQSSSFAGGNSLNICFAPNVAGYYYLTLRVHTPSMNGLSADFVAYYGDTQFATNSFGFNPSGALVHQEFAVDSSLPLCRFMCRVQSSHGLAVYFDAVKVEYYSFRVTDTIRQFTGFAFPGYSLAPEPSPYDEWDGIVRPNLLSQTDFYKYPYYSSGSMDRPVGVYYSDSPTSCFSGYPEDGVYPMSVTSSVNVGQGISSTVVLKYRLPLSYEDYATPLPLVYSLKGYMSDTDYGAFVSIKLSDDRGHTTAQLATFDNGSFLESVPFEYDGLDYLDIEVTLGSRYDVALSCILLYSKLEIGTLFTGFVPEEHNDLTKVNYNLLPNYDFENVPSFGTEEYNAKNWVVSSSTPSNISFARENDGSLGVSASSSASYEFVYRYWDSSDSLPSNTFRFALKGFSTSGITIKAYNLPYALNDSPYAVYYFVPSFDTYDLSVTIPAYSSGLRLVLSVNTGSADSSYSRFAYCKLEYGDAFTGYVGEYDGAYSDGYDRGYTDGYVEGLDQFTSHTYNFEFDNEQSNLTLAQGWSDMGISAASELKNCVWSLSPSWYERFNIPIIASGYMWIYRNSDPDDDLLGVRIYASKYEVNEELYDEYQNIYWVDIYEDNMTLVARDDTFPMDWLSYPIYRNVNITVGRVTADFYDEVYDQAYRKGYYDGEDIGYGNGRTVGYNNGKAVGYKEGLDTAEDGTWLSLVSALIDVPVTTIISFLDFEILGFNMLSALKTIVLLSLFFFVIRFITAKVL